MLWIKLLQSVVYLRQGTQGTKRTDALPQDLVKSRSRAIGVFGSSNRSEIGRHLGSHIAEMLGKFQSDAIIIAFDLATSGLREIWR